MFDCISCLLWNEITVIDNCERLSLIYTCVIDLNLDNYVISCGTLYHLYKYAQTAVHL